MPFYEHVMLVRQDVQSAQAEALAADYVKIIEEGEGRVARVEYWGLKTLAYKIKKNRKAHYILMHIDSAHPPIAEMERQQRISEDVLRSMTVRVDELDEGPSIMMLNKERRDRGERDRGPRHHDRDRAPRPAKTDAKPEAAAADGKPETKEAS